ncbi:MAG: hypothetical protein ACXABM_03065 [Candidatus Thorarchaeota archaeon]|jgi:hypothetical protein
MTSHRIKILSVLVVVLFLGTISPLSVTFVNNSHSNSLPMTYLLGDVPSDQVPLRRVAFVAPDSNSYVDEFAYMATVPTSVFYHNNTQYISPLIYSEGSQSERWLLDDWGEYLETDDGITQAFAVGDFSESYITSLQRDLGIKVYPRITGTSAADIAAKISVSEWSASSSAVLALVEENFNTPSTIVGSTTHTFEDQASEPTAFSGSVNYGAPEGINFTPPSWAGWIEGALNWTGSEIVTHQLIDPNGEIVDYSIYNQVFFSRLLTFVDAPVPLNFWLPKTVDGLWTMNVSRDSATPANPTIMSGNVISHPGHIVPVNVPSGAKWFNVTLTWDNVATDLNLALVDPTGRMTMWAPAGSILSSPGIETIELPYPMAGDWKIIAAWMDATTEQNNIEMSWDISMQSTDLSAYLESASNAAVLASLLNVPLLYVNADQVPVETQWALSRLGVTDAWLVDPTGLQGAALEGLLNTSMTVSNLQTYSSVSSAITGLSESPDIVVTVPISNNNEFFAPATFSAAAHGAPIFSLSADDNVITTRAQETWAPYKIGPEINNIYVINKFENRAENGWYDERIPNKFSMMESVDSFESFVSVRGAYNSTISQPVVVIAPDSLLPLSFDRSLQSHFMPGRIPAETATMASVLINRGVLHRFLFLTAENADTTLVTMYAYTDGADFSDNNYDYYKLFQIENSTDAFEDAGFTNELHVGQNEVFEMVGSQVGLWTISTHGTLTLLPRDPPSRPAGPGYFSLRNADASWGFEVSESVRKSADGDDLVNPVVYSAENANHVTRSTDDLEAAIDNIGSPIVILTACLLGGTGMPLMLMEHGAVGVTGAPRTVYFQPAGMLSVLLAQSLCNGDTLGYALTSGLQTISADYSDPLIDREPRDYANQQILFGDPSVRLYEPSAYPHVTAEDPLTQSYDSHVPGRGTTGIAALGSSSYLPDTLDSLGLTYDYYETSNFTSFTQLLSIRTVVLIEPDTMSVLGANLATSTSELNTYVRNGGVLVVLGVTETLNWLPWDVTFSSTGSGSSITITDDQHPLMSAPNILGSSVDYQGHFSSVWANLSVLATDGSNPVIIAGAIGSGKVALTTTSPSGLLRNSTIENAVSWNEAPSILLSSYTLNQEIIWAGDTVQIDLEFEDLVGNDITGADVTVWLNVSQLDVVDVGSGIFRVTLAGDWTGANLGVFDLEIDASKAGFDTLSLTLEQFILIRPFPWLTIGILGGGVIALVAGWIYVKKKRGDDMPWQRDKTPRDQKVSKEERKRREKEDGKADVREYFGV